MADGIISRVSGPVVIASGLEGAQMFDVVRIGEMGLVGEIIRLEGDKATLQVYEDTTGLRPGEKVINTKRPLSMQLGPGLLTSIYDGIQRPLDVLREQSGDFISRGKVIPALDQTKKWDFVPLKKKGDDVSPGEIIGEVQETPLIMHKIMVPYNVKGNLTNISEGKFTVNDIVATVQNGVKTDIGLSSWWTVRIPRPVLRKLPPEEPLLTGLGILTVHQLEDRKSTRLNSSHGYISYAVFCLKKKKNKRNSSTTLPSFCRRTARLICAREFRKNDSNEKHSARRVRPTGCKQLTDVLATEDLSS